MEVPPSHHPLLLGIFHNKHIQKPSSYGGSPFLGTFIWQVNSWLTFVRTGSAEELKPPPIVEASPSSDHTERSPASSAPRIVIRQLGRKWTAPPEVGKPASWLIWLQVLWDINTLLVSTKIKMLSMKGVGLQVLICSHAVGQSLNSRRW